MYNSEHLKLLSMAIIVDQEPQANQANKKGNKEDNKKTEDAEQSISFWTVVLSVIQASFGVQNQKNKERDFKHGKLLPFVVAALLFTGVFVLTLIIIVKMVLSTA